MGSKADEPIYKQAIVVTNVMALSKRERQTGLLCMEGLSHTTIGNLMGISKNTVKAHLTTIFQILEINSILELALIMWWDTEGRFRQD